MHAFVNGSVGVVASHGNATKLSSRSSCQCVYHGHTLRSPARAKVQWMMCAQGDAAASSEDGAQDRPPEPYPGFYNDMRRGGLSETQAQAQAAKAQGRKTPTPGVKLGGKKSLVGPDGKLLAPWMRVSEDYDQTVIPARGDARGRLAGDPQRQELSGQGLRWKMLGDELVLEWATGAEEGNVGFIVSRRQGKAAEWFTVSDWRDCPADLSSKGPAGGKYSFVVPDAQPGTWVYRISDVDGAGNVSDLSQTLVEIESGDDTRVRTVALIVLLAAIAGFFALSILLDPMSGTS